VSKPSKDKSFKPLALPEITLKITSPDLFIVQGTIIPLLYFILHYIAQKSSVFSQSFEKNPI
jgi:hypothetical protein